VIPVKFGHLAFGVMAIVAGGAALAAKDWGVSFTSFGVAYLALARYREMI